LLESDADAAGVDGGEFGRTPGFFLEWAVGVDDAAALLVFGVEGGDILNQEADHGLFADGFGQSWVAEQVEADACAVALDAGVVRGRAVAEGFGEPQIVVHQAREASTSGVGRMGMAVWMAAPTRTI
jgi:hypothetical protein